MNNLQNISNIELVNELKRRLDLINIKEITPTRESNSVLVGRMENRPERSEYKLLEVFKEYSEGLNFNQRERERIQLTFDAKRFNNNLEPIKEKLKAGQ
ncbi:5722_t:CDS:2, partial [Cetraspora pellucida]